jgi:hypothetical protein
MSIDEAEVLKVGHQTAGMGREPISAFVFPLQSPRECMNEKRDSPH